MDTPDDNPDANLEQLMERMRQFKRQMVFTVAMLDVFYQEPVEKVSDHLTELADVLLEKILDEKIFISIRYTSGVGGIRVSTHYFNNEDDLDRLVEALKRLG